MYLTYEDYMEMGGTLDKPTFDEYEFMAETFVDWYTFNRLRKETSYPRQLTRLMYTLINLIYNKMASMGGVGFSASYSTEANIIKQSNDGVTTEYNRLSAGSMINATNAEVKKLVNFYLQGLQDSNGRKLLYRGIYPGE